MLRPGIVAAIWVVIIAGCGLASTTSGQAPTSVPSATAAPPAAAASAETPTLTPAATSAPTVSVGPVGEWRGVAPMLRARDGFGAVRLADGRVLVVGDDHACTPGGASPGSETAELYDPATDAWSETGSLNKPRKQAALVSMVDGGAMVIGGLNADDFPFSSTKVFQPGPGVWIDGPLLKVARGDPSVAVIDDGRIFVASPTSHDETTSTSTVEINAPWLEGWWEGGQLDGLAVEQLVALTDGRLVAIASTFESPKQLAVAVPSGAEGWHEFPRPDFDDITGLVPLADGGILAFGRGDSELGLYDLTRVQRYDRETDRWRDAAPISTPRSEAQIAVLEGGQILVAGGHLLQTDQGDGEVLDTSEVYDPGTDAWTAGPTLLQPRMDGHALTLEDGSVLILGGIAEPNTQLATPFCPGGLTSVERLHPAP